MDRDAALSPAREKYPPEFRKPVYTGTGVCYTAFKDKGVRSAAPCPFLSFRSSKGGDRYGSV